jgi:hypothetical protein
MMTSDCAVVLWLDRESVAGEVDCSTGLNEVTVFFPSFDRAVLVDEFVAKQIDDLVAHKN